MTTRAERLVAEAFPDAYGEALQRVHDDEVELRQLTARRVSNLLRAQAAQGGPRFVENALLATRSFRAEIALLLGITERAAENLIGYSNVLVKSFPATLEAMERGEISWQHATAIVNELASLPDETSARLEAQALELAPDLTSHKLARMLRTARELAHPDSIEERHEAARQLRGVELLDDKDGMGGFYIRIPSVQSHAIFHRLTDAAQGLDDPLEERTLDQRRADIFMHYLLAEVDGEHFGVVPDEFDDETFVRWFRGFKPEVILSVPVLSLLGQSDEPAILDGWVPIPLDDARIIAAGAESFIRILTHPETGATLSVGRDRYRATADMRRAIRIRDLTCRFPGCMMAAERSELDHKVEWQDGGETSLVNLHALCPGHHALKTSTEWKVVTHPDGSETWTTPGGRTYTTYPYRPFAA